MTARLLLMHLGKNWILQGALKVTMTLQLLSFQERQAHEHAFAKPLHHRACHAMVSFHLH
uniref:Uncharacterized protein n=1 Tax=Arundo donax TaxID=35708 RepID=A0A0A9AX13_ARUDO